jgi:hypothetical protein
MRDSPADTSGTWTARTTCFAAQAQRYTSDHPIAPRLKIFGGRFQDPNRARERPHSPRGRAPQPRAGVLCIPIQLRTDYNLMASISQNPKYLI